MAKRSVSTAVFLAALLIAIQLSTLLMAATASIQYGQRKGNTEIVGIQSGKAFAYATKPLKIDREKTLQNATKTTTASATPKQQVTRVTQATQVTNPTPVTQQPTKQQAASPPVEPSTPTNDTSQSNIDVSNYTASASPGIYSSNPDLGLYSDSACMLNLTSIDWGTISPGGSVTRTIYVKNKGDSVLTLNMFATNWSPANANGPLTLTWDKEGVALEVNRVLTATLRLNVSSNISGITSFDLDVVISGTG